MVTECREINISGVVQGVGFRPFVYRLAKALKITGYVKNIGADVLISAEGTAETLDIFITEIKNNNLPAAQINDITISSVKTKKYSDFVIADSDINAGSTNNVSADIAICDDCRNELFNPADRRYQYPLINCTNCGPRYSIINAVPYDRCNTTMINFEMCDDCNDEYNDPDNRRFHAQPISCHNCGPQVTLSKLNGEVIATKNEAIIQASALLLTGEILAIKGIGGYHLACNADDAMAIQKLRTRKKRDEKPFAIMAANIADAMEICQISAAEKLLLNSPAAPIVLLQKSGKKLPADIAPDNDYLGVMLPYTPLQLQLFYHSKLKYMVMTSANIIDEPIIYDDEDANARLIGIADYTLTHNRPIHTRVDDSVAKVFDDKPIFLRRSRGYVPTAINLNFIYENHNILACGGHLKNSFCINNGSHFFISQHIGDLENYETYQSYTSSIKLVSELLQVTPEYIACDLHPDYLSTQYANDSGLEVVAVQHHRAHIAGCMAENNYAGEIIGVAFDGTGYGDDGNIWGGEFFTGTLNNLQRAAHLEYIDLPAEHGRSTPWKSAIGYLIHNNIDTGILCEKENDTELLSSYISKKINTYKTSSMGRLFDAVSAIIGIKKRITYEGQAAIALEFVANSYDGAIDEYAFNISSGGIMTVEISGIINGVITDKLIGCSNAYIAARFHETIAQIILKMALKLRDINKINHIALSGGVFQNNRLLKRVYVLLTSANFNILINRILPANDGGISLGQSVLALYRKGE